jgi:hypothetical protein
MKKQRIFIKLKNFESIEKIYNEKVDSCPRITPTYKGE